VVQRDRIVVFAKKDILKGRPSEQLIIVLIAFTELV
jgi:hypothetical protein